MPNVYISPKIDSAKKLETTLISKFKNVNVVTNWESSDIIFQSRADNVATYMKTCENSKRRCFFNVFPDHNEVTNKRNLATNVKSFCDEFNIRCDDVIPKTFISLSDVKQQQRCCLFIVKPNNAFGGKGVYVTKNVAHVDFNANVVQEYIQPNAQTFKRDYRVNLFIGEHGNVKQFAHVLERRCSTPFDVDNIDDLSMHITNTDIPEHRVVTSKLDPSTKEYSAISLFMMKFVRPFILHVVYKKYRDYTKCITDSAKYNPLLNDQYIWKHVSCFQRFGIDIIIDVNGKPLLLEINTNPGYPPEFGDILFEAHGWFCGLGPMNDALKDDFTENERIYSTSFPEIDNVCLTRDKNLTMYLNPTMFNINAIVLMLFDICKKQNVDPFDIIANEWDNADVVWKNKFSGFSDIFVHRSGVVVNKFPHNTNVLTYKHNLTNAVKNTFPMIYTKFYPKTVYVMNNQKLKTLSFNPDALYIIKPCDGSAGIGIDVLRGKDIRLKKVISSKFGPNGPCVIQEYISDPKLLDGKKFDIRVNIVVLPNADVWMYNKLLLRKSDTMFTTDNLDKRIHVTNIHGRSECDETMLYTPENDELFNMCKTFVTNIVVPLIMKYIVNKVDATNKLCMYQFFGIDVVQRSDNTLWLIEINGNPGTAGDDILTRMNFVLSFNQNDVERNNVLKKYFVRVK